MSESVFDRKEQLEKEYKKRRDAILDKYEASNVLGGFDKEIHNLNEEYIKKFKELI